MMSAVFITWSVASFCQRVLTFMINLRQTRWPLATFGNILRAYSSRHAALLTHAETLAQIEVDDRKDALQEVRSVSLPSLKMSSSKSRSNLKMYDLLTNEKAFELFIAHCSAEHATGRHSIW